MAQGLGVKQVMFSKSFNDLQNPGQHLESACRHKETARNAVVAPMASLPQTVRRIGRFEVVRALGRGTQGSVWLAHDPDLQRDVAIKTIEVDGADNPAAVKTLLDEAVMMSRLVHPNIVTLFDAGRDHDQPYLVFEFVPGETLASMIKTRGRLGAIEACEIAVNMLKGIAFAHQKGVVHRDLKPGNVMMTEDGIPRIMDFGIAALVSTRDAADEGFHGTPAYTAPEYIQSRAFSPRSDVFSMGMVLYEMLTGGPAVTGRTVWEILHKVSNVPFDPPSAKADGVDERLSGMVMRALAKNPDDRFESATALCDALESFLKPAPTAIEKQENSTGTLEFLLRRMRVKSDFPALSSTISTVSKAANSDKDGVNALSSTILKDFALTNKLLKLVNSAHYGQFGRGISTVSRAIMVLGFDQVRSIAISLMLFDHLQNKAQANTLRDEIIATYFTAVLGRSLASPMGLRDGEEAFICAMFNKLGRVLSAFYFHEEFVEIQKMERAGSSENEAATQVLGMPLDALGIGVAKSWHFPEPVLASMKALSPIDLQAEHGEIDQLRLLAGAAAALTDIIRYTPDANRASKLIALEKEYQPLTHLDQSHYIAAVTKAVADIGRDAAALDLKIATSPFFERAVAWSQQFSEAQAVDEVAQTIASTVLLERDPTESAGGDPVAREIAKRKAILTAGIQDITNALVGKYQLNDLLRIVAETMFRGVGFARVLLLIRDPASNTLKTRIGLGKDADQILKKGFGVPLTPSKDIFHVSLSTGADIYIEDVDTPKMRAHIPEWYRKAIPGKSLALFPIVLNKKPVALLYGDSEVAGSLSFGPEELSLLKTLRNQAVLAIRNQNA